MVAEHVKLLFLREAQLKYFSPLRPGPRRPALRRLRPDGPLGRRGRPVRRRGPLERRVAHRGRVRDIGAHRARRLLSQRREVRKDEKTGGND